MIRYLIFIKGFLISIFYLAYYFGSIIKSKGPVCLNGLVQIKKGKLIFNGSFNSRSGLFININGGELSFGNKVFANRNISINCQKRINVGDYTMFGENVCIYDHDHKQLPNGEISLNDYDARSIIIGNNVWVGSNVVILKGVVIGDKSIISAGSVVYKDVPENSIYINGDIRSRKSSPLQS